MTVLLSREPVATLVSTALSLVRLPEAVSSVLKPKPDGTEPISTPPLPPVREPRRSPPLNILKRKKPIISSVISPPPPAAALLAPPPPPV